VIQRQEWPRVFELRIRQIRKDENFAETVRDTLVTETGCVELLHEPRLAHKGKGDDQYIWRGAEIKVRDAGCMQAMIARASANSGMHVSPRLAA
jgi:hypothetical protein